MRALRAKGTPVFALTNFGIESFAYAQTQYDFLNEFDRFHVSGHMRCIKPAPRIYEMVEEDCGLSGSEPVVRRRPARQYRGSACPRLAGASVRDPRGLGRRHSSTTAF
jgi:hypothetical protein